MLRNRLMVGTLSAHQFFFHVESFTADTIETFIRTKINIARIIDFLQDETNGLHVIRIGRADEIIVGYGQLGPQAAELQADPVRVLLGADSRLLCSFGNFIAVFIRTGDKKSFVSSHAGVPGQNVGNNGCIGMSDMW